MKPAQKDLPSPVSTMTRQSLSMRTLMRKSLNSAIWAYDMALRFAASLKLHTYTGPRRSMMSFS